MKWSVKEWGPGSNAFQNPDVVCVLAELFKDAEQRVQGSNVQQLTSYTPNDIHKRLQRYKCGWLTQMLLAGLTVPTIGACIHGAATFLRSVAPSQIGLIITVFEVIVLASLAQNAKQMTVGAYQTLRDDTFRRNFY